MQSRGKPQSISALFPKRMKGFLGISGYASSSWRAAAGRARHDVKSHRWAPRLQTRKAGASGLCRARDTGNLFSGDGSDLGPHANLLVPWPRHSGRGVRPRHIARGWPLMFPSHGSGSPSRRHQACGAERKGGYAPVPPWPRLFVPKTQAIHVSAGREPRRAPHRGQRPRPPYPSLTWLGRFRWRLGHGWSRPKHGRGSGATAIGCLCAGPR